MNQYYLMSQLPSLDGIGDSSAVPITEERFNELCERFLSKKVLKSLGKLTLVPPREADKSGSAFIDSWNEGERMLRLALGGLRAGKLKKSFDTENESFSPLLLQAARTAVELQDPLAAEQFLNRYRLSFLESLRPSDPFCEDAVFYYGLKLKLISRIQNFDENKGREEYRNIYDSIMNGEEQEA